MLRLMVCEIPGCGVGTLVYRYSDCQVWIDKDNQGTPDFLNVCPSHKAEWVKMVSQFLIGDGSAAEVDGMEPF